MAEQFLDTMLVGVYEQSQYPLIFDLDAAAAEDDDVFDEVEVSSITVMYSLFAVCCYCGICDWVGCCVECAFAAFRSLD